MCVSFCLSLYIHCHYIFEQNYIFITSDDAKLQTAGYGFGLHMSMPVGSEICEPAYSFNVVGRILVA